MGRACAVPKCKTGYKSVKEKCSVFKVPKNIEQLKKWQAAIPGVVLKQSQCVCEKHFEQKCILREWVRHDSEGRIIAKVTYLKPRLEESAVPTIFDNLTTSVPPVSEKPTDGVVDDSNSLEDQCKSVKSESDKGHPMVTLDKTLVPHVSDKPTDGVVNDSNSLEDQCRSVKCESDKEPPMVTLDKTLVPPLSGKPMNGVFDGSNSPENQCKSVKCESFKDPPKVNLDAESATPSAPQETIQHEVLPVTPVPSAASDSPNQEVVDTASIVRRKNFVLSKITINDSTSDEVTSEKNPITIPASWGVTEYAEEKGQRVVFSSILRSTTNGTASTIINKSVEVEVDKTLRYCVYGRPMDPERWQLPPVLTDTTLLPRTLERFRRLNVCQGIGPVNIHHLSTDSVFQDSVQRWRQNDCTMLAKQKRCEHCRKMRRRTIQRELRSDKAKNIHRIGNLSNPIDRWKLIALREKISRERRANNYLKRRVKSLTESLEGKAKELSSIRAEALDDKISQLQVPQIQRTAIREIISAATRRDAKSRRYSEDWLMLCFMMHLRSPTYYEFLRENDVLPLPCARTIRSYFTLINVE